MEHYIIRQLYQNALKEEANKDKISKETKTEVETLLKKQKVKKAARSTKNIWTNCSW